MACRAAPAGRRARGRGASSLVGRGGGGGRRSPRRRDRAPAAAAAAAAGRSPGGAGTAARWPAAADGAEPVGGGPRRPPRPRLGLVGLFGLGDDLGRGPERPGLRRGRLTGGAATGTRRGALGGFLERPRPARGRAPRVTSTVSSAASGAPAGARRLTGRTTAGTRRGRSRRSALGGRRRPSDRLDDLGGRGARPERSPYGSHGDGHAARAPRRGLDGLGSAATGASAAGCGLPAGGARVGARRGARRGAASSAAGAAGQRRLPRRRRSARRTPRLPPAGGPAGRDAARRLRRGGSVSLGLLLSRWCSRRYRVRSAQACGRISRHAPGRRACSGPAARPA